MHDGEVLFRHKYGPGARMTRLERTNLEDKVDLAVDCKNGRRSGRQCSKAYGAVGLTCAGLVRRSKTHQRPCYPRRKRDGSKKRAKHDKKHESKRRERDDTTSSSEDNDDTDDSEDVIQDMKDKLDEVADTVKDVKKAATSKNKKTMHFGYTYENGTITMDEFKAAALDVDELDDGTEYHAYNIFHRRSDSVMTNRNMIDMLSVSGGNKDLARLIARMVLETTYRYAHIEFGCFKTSGTESEMDYPCVVIILQETDRDKVVNGASPSSLTSVSEFSSSYTRAYKYKGGMLVTPASKKHEHFVGFMRDADASELADYWRTFMLVVKKYIGEHNLACIGTSVHVKTANLFITNSQLARNKKVAEKIHDNLPG